MTIEINTNSNSFRYTFAASLLIFSALLFAAATYSWTGPAGSPPNNNVDAPINVGTASQVKDGALSVDGLSVYGSQYIQTNLGIGTTPSSAWGAYVTGSQGGVYGQATNGQAIRGYGTDAGSYGGHFVGYGGVYSQNLSGYYTYLNYPGSAWGVYTNGATYTANYSRADGGFCIGGSCKTSWTQMGSSYWTGWMNVADPGTPTISCSSGYVVTGFGSYEWNSDYRVDAIRLLCTRLAP